MRKGMAGEISGFICSRSPVDDLHPIVIGVDHIKREGQRVKNRVQESILPFDFLPIPIALLVFLRMGL